MPSSSDKVGSSSCDGPACSNTFEDRGYTLSAAYAHGHQSISALDAIQLMQGFDGNDSTGGAYGVAQTDAAAIRINLGRIHFQTFDHRACLRRKCLIGLDDVHLVYAQASLFQCYAGGRHRANAHVLRINTGMTV